MNQNIYACKRALVSVADKTGLVEFLSPLVKKGLQVISTGGTAKYLEEHGIPVMDVESQTGFPEVMDGRVKTLHPKIHMCLLSRDFVKEDLKTLKDYNLEPFDLVIGNLYAFEEALNQGLKDRDLAEFIDIGGPSFLRAAAKSFEQITVVCDPNNYSKILKKENLSLLDRKKLAAEVFSHVSSYDAMIAAQLGLDINSSQIGIGGDLVSELRYGENPAQQASWYRVKGVSAGLQNAEILQGKALSYNNLLDLDSAVQTLREFNEPTCVAVKHLNPCGVASSTEIHTAIVNSMLADPVSVFGGIIAINRTLDKKAAEEITKGFIECVIAPEVTDEANEILVQKKNLRVLKWSHLLEKESDYNFRSISGGFLVQTQDVVSGWNDQWKIIGNKVTPEQIKNLEFAWKICAHLKSNAIAMTSGLQSVGLGMGQVNRVDAVEQAIMRQKKHHPKASDLILASDAFFPFEDSIELAFRAGIKWVIQPGGSVRDEQVIAKSKELGVNLILTDQRHFQH